VRGAPLHAIIFNGSVKYKRFLSALGQMSQPNPSDVASAIAAIGQAIDRMDERLAKLERGQYAIRSNHNDLVRKHQSLDRMFQRRGAKTEGAS
jgi:hypothetical protein